jgi:hypothetical protein
LSTNTAFMPVALGLDPPCEPFPVVQKITNHRDNGRYSLIHSSEYVLDGLVYRVNYDSMKKGYHPIRKAIIDALIKQIHAMQSHYSNVLVSDLFERLRGRFKMKAWNGQPAANGPCM